MATIDYTIGLSEVQFGTAAADGTMPTSTTKVGIVYKDTCNVSQDASDVTEHYEEGKSVPFYRKKSKKAPTLAFSLVVDDLNILKDTIGGSVSSDGNSWGFDGDDIPDNKAVRLVTKQGVNIEIPNGDIDANLNSDFSESGIFLVEVTVTPLSVSGSDKHAFNCVKKSE